MSRALTPNTRVRVPTRSGPQWGTVERRRHGTLIDSSDHHGVPKFEWRGEEFTRSPGGDYFVRLDRMFGVGAWEFVRVHETEVEGV